MAGVSQRSFRRALILAAATALAVAIAAVGWRLASPNEVSRLRRLIDAGQPEQAALAISELKQANPERLADVYFLEGYLAAHRDHRVVAARLFARALEEDPGRWRGSDLIYDRTVPWLESPECAVRSEAARTLGLLGQRRAAARLREALAREPAPGAAGTPGACDFQAVAAEALARLEA